MSNRQLNFQKRVYESKQARDVLDEEFIEFGPIKRNINEFFDIYNNKFYNISKPTHKFLAEESFKYATDYINPKFLQVLSLQKQKEQIQIDIDSIEHKHILFPNNIILQKWAPQNTNLNEITFYFLQSGKKRLIQGVENVLKVKDFLRKKGLINVNDPRGWSISVPSATINGIPSGPNINSEEDIFISIYEVNTGKKLPSNIYIG